MHPIYFSHGYREREAPFVAFFSSLMAKVGFIPSLDPPSNDVNSSKLERHLSCTSGMVSILSNRGKGHPSPYILYEIALALRSNKPTLVFVEDSVNELFIPKNVIVKRFSEYSYIRETTNHLHALNQLSAYIGKVQLPRYRSVEYQKSCMLIGDNKINNDIKIEIEKTLIQKGYLVKYLKKSDKVIPMSGDFHSNIYQTNLAISILTSNSKFDNYVLGILQSSLIPTITLSIGDYPLIDNIPKEYQRRIITNNNVINDIDIISKQINLFEEDFIEIDSSSKVSKYADKLSDSNFENGKYTHKFRDIIIKEINMGDKYEAGQVGAQGANASAYNSTFNQVLQKNENKLDLEALRKDLLDLRISMQKEATTAEHFSEIGTIANAEIEAKNGNTSKSLEYLSKTGKWSLEVAEKIGVGVATAAIKATLGI
jgi:hypothetical protein